MLSQRHALQQLSGFVSELPRFYTRPNSDYRGRSIDVASVGQYLASEKYRFAEIASMLPDPEQTGTRLLDIGIAYGFLTVLLQQDGKWSCEGLELAENIPVYCPFARGHGVTLHSGKLGLDSLPFPDAAFGAVIFSEVLEHLRLSPKLVLGELRRILKPGGLLLLTTPNVARLTNLVKLFLGRNIMEAFPEDVRSENITEYLTHIREYTMQELCSLLDRHGFAVRQARFSQCMEQDRLHRWITACVPPWRGNLVLLAEKKT